MRRKRVLAWTLAVVLAGTSAVLALPAAQGVVVAAEEDAGNESGTESAGEVSGKCGENAYYTFKDGVLTISGSGSIKDYGYDEGTMSTTYADAPWNDLDDGITEVRILEGITRIGAYAFFEGCSNLQTIIIPDSVTEIGGYAFNGDSNLEIVTGGKNVETVDEGAFGGTNWLKCASKEKVGVVWGTYLGKAFIRTMDSNISEKENLYGVFDMGGLFRSDYVELPDGTVMLVNGANGWDGLIEEKTISAIADEGCCAFLDGGWFDEGESTAHSLILPEGIEYIGEGGFHLQASLTEITMPSTLKVIARRAFVPTFWFDVCGVSRVKLNEGLETIGEEAFQNSSLKEVTIPKSVKEIGDHAFGYYWGWNEDAEKYDFLKTYDDFTISGYTGTAAETYAKENGFTFIALDEQKDEEDTYVLDLTQKDGTVSVDTDTFAGLLEENKTKTVVIKTKNDVTFTFRKGEMKAVEGKDSYDFTVDIYRDFDAVKGLSAAVAQSSFVLLADYHYAGQLPAKASIRLYAGKELAGKTLYYSSLSEDGKTAPAAEVTVDAKGYITVEQEHCSRYLLTSEQIREEETQKPGGSGNTGEAGSDRPSTGTGEAGNENTSSNAGEAGSVLPYLLLAGAAGAVIVRRRCERA